MTVLTGTWNLVNGTTAPIGTEKWKLEESTELISWTSMVERTTPFPHEEHLSVTVVPRTWKTRTITIRSIGNGQQESFEGVVEKNTFHAKIRRGTVEEHFSTPVTATIEFD